MMLDRRQLVLKKLIAEHEHEREKIAILLRDDAVQVMTAANIWLAILAAITADTEMAADIESLMQGISLSTARLRQSIAELQPCGTA